MEITKFKDELFDFLIEQNASDVFDLANELHLSDEDEEMDMWNDMKNDISHEELVFEVIEFLDYQEYPTIESFKEFWKQTY